MTTLQDPIVFYGFWRSNAAYRIRVAMNLKGLPYREIPVNLDAGAQRAPDFLARNPFGAVPALLVGEGAPLTQSLAILDYLEEMYPTPPLLPKDPRGRAMVRALAADVACDTHPLIAPRVRIYLTKAGFDADAIRAWQGHWIVTALNAIESKLAANPDTGRFCYADEPTIADICVSGLLMMARMFRFETPATPTVERIVANCSAIEAFAKADAMRQPDAPKA